MHGSFAWFAVFDWLAITNRQNLYVNADNLMVCPWVIRIRRNHIWISDNVNIQSTFGKELFPALRAERVISLMSSNTCMHVSTNNALFNNKNVQHQYPFFVHDTLVSDFGGRGDHVKFDWRVCQWVFARVFPLTLIIYISKIKQDIPRLSKLC